MNTINSSIVCSKPATKYYLTSYHSVGCSARENQGTKAEQWGISFETLSAAIAAQESSCQEYSRALVEEKTIDGRFVRLLQGKYMPEVSMGKTIPASWDTRLPSAYEKVARGMRPERDNSPAIIDNQPGFTRC